MKLHRLILFALCVGLLNVALVRAQETIAPQGRVFVDFVSAGKVVVSPARGSTLRMEGDLTRRRLLTPMELPVWPLADVIAPSQVQVLVNEAGNVVSAVLLPSDNSREALSHNSTADQRALEFARAAQFAPAPHLTIGRMIFTGLTVPPPATNSPAAAP